MAPFVVFLRRTEMKIELSTFCTNSVEKRKKVWKTIHILSTQENGGKAHKIELCTKLSTLSTFYVCGILDLHKKEKNKCFV